MSGAILHNVDGGPVWTAQESHTEIFLRSAYFIDNRNGWIAGDNGLIIRTEDGGQTWKPAAKKGPVYARNHDVHVVDGLNGGIIGRDGGSDVMESDEFRRMLDDPFSAVDLDNRTGHLMQTRTGLPVRYR